MPRLQPPDRRAGRFQPVQSPRAKPEPVWADVTAARAGATPWREVGAAFGAAAVVAVLALWLLPRNFPWLLCAIPHELGHATAGCVLGLPSTPAISLRGEAWTGHGAFRPWLAIAVPVAMAAFAVAFRRRPALALGLAAGALLLPLCAFTGAGRVLTIAAGHLAELLFAGYCYAIAVTGGRTHTRAERTAAATAGAILQFVNVKLCFGLMTSAAARTWYASSGSLGIKNDYLRLSEDVFGCRLESVAFAMLLLALLPLPLGALAGHLRNRAG